MTRLKTISRSFNSIYLRFGNIPFLGVLILIMVYLWANGRSFFPDWDASYGQLIQTYIVMTLIFLVLAVREQRIKKEMQTPIWKAGRNFALFLFLTWGVMQGAVKLGLINVSSYPLNLVWQTIFVQFCVVAVAEELMFRGVMLQYIDYYLKSKTIAIVGSSVVFAFWHVWAYQIIFYDPNVNVFSFISLMMAFLMGVILAVIALNREWGGLSATIAVHGMYNLMILGVLSL